MTTSERSMSSSTDLSRYWGHFIDGSYCTFEEKHSRILVDPATGRPLTEVPEGDVDAVEAAVTSSARAFDVWRSTTPKDRARLISELCDAIQTDTDVLADLDCRQVGKTTQMARDEVQQGIDAVRFYAGAARAATSVAPAAYTAGRLSVAIREPIGVIGAIMPWNYPLMLALWKIGPALAAGNTIVLKPSELTPLSTLRIAEIAADVLPSGVINVVLGSGTEVGGALVAHPTVQGVSLTGSVQAGRSVAMAAADGVKRVHLELGGKAPVIIFPDADLTMAARTVAIMGTWNAGQECAAATRVLAARECHDEFSSELVAQMRALPVGPAGMAPSDAEVNVGPLISEVHRDRVAELVRDAQAGRSETLTGGDLVHGNGWFYAPTVLSVEDRDAPILRTEVFGPVVTVETFDAEEDALDRANMTDYGLCASVWTSDVARAIRMFGRLEFGTVWINDHLTLVSEMPWSGFKRSGNGADLSILGLDSYSRVKHVMMAF